MDQTAWEIIAGAGGAVITALGGLLMLRPKTASVYSDSAVALSNAYGTLIDKLNEDVKRLDSELAALRTERTALQAQLAAALNENVQLKARVRVLEEQVADLAARR